MHSCQDDDGSLGITTLPQMKATELKVLTREIKSGW